MRDLLVAWNFEITKSFRSRDLIKEITERFCFGLFWVILCSTCHTHNLNHWVEFVFLFFFLLSFTWQIGCNWYICYFFAYLIRMSNLSSLGFCSQMFVLAQWYFFKRFFFKKKKNSVVSLTQIGLDFFRFLSIFITLYFSMKLLHFKILRLSY